jgi:hypothetical protein
MSHRGALCNCPSALTMTVFLRDVIAANPSKVAAWLDALADLPPDDVYMLRTAAWYSGTSEAMQYLAERGSTEFSETARNGLTWKTRGGEVLDALWSHYFATVDLAAVRRIISVLEFMSELGDAESCPTAKHTEEDPQRAPNNVLFEAACWSLGCLMQEYPPLQEYCGKLVSADQLSGESEREPEPSEPDSMPCWSTRAADAVSAVELQRWKA